ncbi:unnamed protein product, partial [marine sediment metagenome]
TILLRQSYREGNRVRKRTLANLTALPPDVIEILRRALRGEKLVPCDEAFAIERSIPHGHVKAILGTIRKIGLDTIITSSDLTKTEAYYLKQNGGARPGVALGRSPVKTAFGNCLRRNGKVVDEPKKVTGYIAWLHILATTPLDDEHEDRTGLRIVRSAIPGKNGLPVILDCSALPLDEPTP